jgi:AcrR family transcriptional regulator
MTARKSQRLPRTRARAGKSTKLPRASQAFLVAPREPGRRLSPDERRAQIIEAVEELFKTRSYAEIGVPDVAERVGITQGLVYHYFPTKEALLVAAVELRAQELLRFCSPDAALPFVVQVQNGVKGYIDYVEAHGLAYANLFKGATAAEPEVLRICEETRMQLIERFLQALGVHELQLPATRLSLRGYVGYSESVILKWLEQRSVPRATIERLCLAAIIDALRVGLASDPELALSPEQLRELERAYRDHLELP